MAFETLSWPLLTGTEIDADILKRRRSVGKFEILIGSFAADTVAVR
jgi:hypothetical protein